MFAARMEPTPSLKKTLVINLTNVDQLRFNCSLDEAVAYLKVFNS